MERDDISVKTLSVLASFHGQFLPTSAVTQMATIVILGKNNKMLTKSKLSRSYVRKFLRISQKQKRYILKIKIILKDVESVLQKCDLTSGFHYIIRRFQTGNVTILK